MPSRWEFPSVKLIRAIAPVYMPTPTTDFNRGLIAKGMSCVHLCLWMHTLSRANAALESIALRLPEPRPSVRKPHNGRYTIAPGFYSSGVPAAFLD